MLAATSAAVARAAIRNFMTFLLQETRPPADQRQTGLGVPGSKPQAPDFLMVGLSYQMRSRHGQGRQSGGMREWFVTAVALAVVSPAQTTENYRGTVLRWPADRLPSFASGSMTLSLGAWL